MLSMPRLRARGCSISTAGASGGHGARRIHKASSQSCNHQVTALHYHSNTQTGTNTLNIVKISENECETLLEKHLLCGRIPQIILDSI